MLACVGGHAMARRKTWGEVERERRKSGRRRWSEREARERVAAWRASGLNLMTWCRREGIGYERMRGWRLQFGAQWRAAPSLLPVEVVASSEPAFCFEVELPRGLRLRVASGFDPASFSELLRAIEAQP